MSTANEIQDTPPTDLSPNQWEQAYLRFETRDQELRKFTKRFVDLGARDWPKDSEVVELFCGRGTGLHALAGIGFTRLEGVDLSPALIAEYQGDAICHVADCRELPFAERSKDIMTVQGGLHHLLELPQDLDQTLSEIHRVLRDQGLVVIVEPWKTPFLSFVHWVAARSLARAVWGKIDALAIMMEHERSTYEQWLNRPDEIKSTLSRYFRQQSLSIKWGTFAFVGTPIR